MTIIRTPDVPTPEKFTDPAAAVLRLEELYEQATKFLCDSFAKAMEIFMASPTDGIETISATSYWPSVA